jgi:hypothetical protein
LGLVLDRDKTIVEDSKDLVTPKFDEVFFGVLVCLLGHVEALEDFADISHVENIVRLGRSRKELLRHGVEELNCSNSEGFAECLDLFRE